MLRNIFFNFHVDSGTLMLAMPVLTLGILLFGFHIAQERKNGDDLLVLSWQSMARAGLYAFIFITILAVGLKPIPFIYFQF